MGMVTNTPMGMEHLLGKSAPLPSTFAGPMDAPLDEERLRQLEREAPEGERQGLAELREAVASGAVVTPVRSEVAHAVTVGNRELRRRKRRQAKQARKRNR